MRSSDSTPQSPNEKKQTSPITNPAPTMTPPLRAKRFPQPSMGVQPLPSFEMLCAVSGGPSLTSPLVQARTISPGQNAAGASGTQPSFLSSGAGAYSFPMRPHFSTDDMILSPCHVGSTVSGMPALDYSCVPPFAPLSTSPSIPPTSQNGPMLSNSFAALSVSCPPARPPSRTSPHSGSGMPSQGEGPSSGGSFCVLTQNTLHSATGSDALAVGATGVRAAQEESQDATNHHNQSTSCNDNIALDVQGFYSHHQVNGVPVIPQELPSSDVLYVLTTSEGRDKLFKCLQYLLKIGIWVLSVPNIIPEGSLSFATDLMYRFAGNVQTIRNGRSMFKLGRWIITVFHLHVVIMRLLRKHAPTIHSAVEGFGNDVTLCLGRLLGLRWGEANQAITHTISNDGAPQEPAASSAQEQEVAAQRQGTEGEGTSSPRDQSSAFLRPATIVCESNSGDESKEDFGVVSAPSGEVTAPSSQLATPSRPRVVSFPDVDSQRQQASFHPHHHEPQPGSVALPIRWRKHTTTFSTPLMILLAIRCASSVARNITRDALYLTAKKFLKSDALLGNHQMLQTIANRSWVIVSVIDLFLNTYRLMDAGWFQYAKVRRSFTAKCLCRPSDHHLRNASLEGKMRRKLNIHFAPVDLDFGSVTPATAKFFEAANPVHMQPVCDACGHIYGEPQGSSSAQGTVVNPVAPKALFVPWLIRKSFDLYWICTSHPNLSNTLLLQLRYLCDVVSSIGFSFGGYEPVAGEAPIDQHMHISASVAGLISGLVALYRVKLSAAK